MLPQTTEKRSKTVRNAIKWNELLNAVHVPFETEQQRREHIKLARRHSVAWYQIEACGTVYPQYADRAVITIRNVLGYLPFPTVYLPQEVFVRTLIADFENGQLPADEFLDRVRTHIVDIRNDEMRIEGVAENPVYSEGAFAFYNSHLIEYKQAARARIVHLLGYEPSLHHSLYAEMLLRDLFAASVTANASKLSDRMPHDCKAMRVVKFREHFTTGGIETANSSALIDWKE